ncbi:GroES-like protein [Cadophora sp. DSE1049]|nr:GroES-like protein [Cadophora sp. DSE1049]
MSSTNSAAFIDAIRAHPLAVKAAPMPPSPSSNQVTIKAHSIAINGIDCIVQQTSIIVPENAYPFILGNDIAGEVIAVGSSVSKVKPGDRVIASAVMLFQKDTLALDFPRVNPVPNGKLVLVWGGGSAVGSNGIQMLKAAGYEIAAVAGASNQQYFRCGRRDYQPPQQHPVRRGFLCDYAPETIQACAQIASQLGDSPKNKFVATSLAHSMKFEGEVPEGVTIGYCWGDTLKHNEVGPAIWDRWLTPVLANGSMKCKPEPKVVGKGLESIQEAIDLQFRGVSAKKLVVEVV